MADQIVPLTNSPNQEFQITLSIDGEDLTLGLSLRYNELAGYWIMAVDDQFSNRLLDSVPLITGAWPAANILGQYAYLAIGSAFVINASNTTAMDYPDSTNLGTDFVLLWGDTPAAVA